jgi:hypothetical protein
MCRIGVLMAHFNCNEKKSKKSLAAARGAAQEAQGNKENETTSDSPFDLISGTSVQAAQPDRGHCSTPPTGKFYPRLIEIGLSGA